MCRFYAAGPDPPMSSSAVIVPRLPGVSVARCAPWQWQSVPMLQPPGVCVLRAAEGPVRAVAETRGEDPSSSTRVARYLRDGHDVDRSSMDAPPGDVRYSAGL
jgi:hypothetical protein